MLKQALQAVCEKLPVEAKSVPLQHWTEGVFRFMLIRELNALSPNIKCLSEWDRIDLVLPTSTGTTIVEFKFFTNRDKEDHEGKIIGRKGFASLHNFRDFQISIERLRVNVRAPWVLRGGRVSNAFLILAYADSIESKRKHSYAKFYDKLDNQPFIQRIEPIVERLPVSHSDHFTCKMLTVKIGQ
jgi:hypothetical protein